jgi:hypothetical protein
MHQEKRGGTGWLQPCSSLRYISSTAPLSFIYLLSLDLLVACAALQHLYMSIYKSTPDGGFTPSELASSEAPTIYASIAVVSVIATVGVVLRFVSRAYSKTTLSYDDYTIVLALVPLSSHMCLTLSDIATRYSCTARI